MKKHKILKRLVKIKYKTMSQETLTPQERKEQFIQQLEKRIEGMFASGNLTAKFETAQCAPSYGWSVEEYMYMPIVAQRLRAKGYSVSSSVNWEVTDWVIAV
jgi:hypothetical protein